jgi:hypothetical protein
MKLKYLDISSVWLKNQSNVNNISNCIITKTHGKISKGNSQPNRT